ncbi:MAG: hypothetical protein M1825_005374 [Sarcosagium campestre]|nr:MAG: hypothetical protein M1825_005374 [Sarcosagium campestre]
MAGLIAMVSVFVVVSIEMFFATRGAGHMHSSEYDTLPNDEAGQKARHLNGRVQHHERLQSQSLRPKHGTHESLRPFRQGIIGSNDEDRDIGLDDMHGAADGLIASASPITPNSPGASYNATKYTDQGHEDSDLDLEELDPEVDATGLLNGTSRSANGHYHRPRSMSAQRSAAGMGAASASTPLSEMQEQKKMLLQCLLLEAGILFHSVFIGMALSVATGTSFIVLLVAISFHQTFEGLALGSRIAGIPSLPPTSPKPWLMALAYGATTPLGQAIGLLVHNLYDPASQTGLLMVGVMNAISSGLLLFAGLVELLAEDFLSDKSYDVLRGRRRMQACSSVAAGGALMAFVGAWA